MSEEKQTLHENIPAAVIKEKKSISLIWLIPLIALAMGVWLSVKALNEKGPTVTINFQSADGLVAGKTKIKYKDVTIGLVEDIRFGKDLENVILTASLDPEMRPYLTDNTRFWVVRARLSGGKVSGLGTLLSGAYISMTPGEPGKKVRKFIGMEESPPLVIDVPGTRYVLTSPTLSSLDVGTSIFYRKLKVGEVIDYQLTEKGDGLEIEVFIKAPYDKHVLENSRFWNVSGIDVELGADGVNIKTESLSSILLGGIAFGNTKSLGKKTAAIEGREFQLFATETKAFEKSYSRKEHYMMYIEGSARGLVVGSPVTFLGIHAGKVIGMQLEYDLSDDSFKIPVLIELEPDRLTIIGQREGKVLPTVEGLVSRGLRAQLRSGSLLTGQLLIDFEMYPDADIAEVYYEDGVAVLPTVPTSMAAIKSSLQGLMNKIESMPLEEIGNNLNGVLAGVNKLANSGDLRETLKNLNTASAQLNKTLETAEGVVGGFDESSAAYQDIRKTMNELSAAARSLRLMMDYLERHPDALIKGK
ncbi:MAG: MCE family protein [Gammaproteobacteria bacterium]|nr:MCE family protein [Gammaproteobacteria bacterium]